MENCWRKERWPNLDRSMAKRTWRKSSSRLWRRTTGPRRSSDMGMRNIGIVYRKELTEALRDRRTLITTFLVPLLMIPLLGSGFTAVMAGVIGKAKREKPKVM